MKTRVLGWGLVVVGLAVGVVRAEEPAPAAPSPAPITWSPADARVTQGDAPLYLQVFVGDDGRIALRSTVAGAKPEWKERGVWSLAGANPEEQAEALKGLQSALSAVHTDPSPARLREPSQHSSARLLVDAQPAVPWRHVQWVLTTACHHRVMIYRLAFSTLQRDGWIDEQLPRDDEGRGAPVALHPDATGLKVKLRRKQYFMAAADRFTRINLSRGPRYLDGVREESPEVEGERPPSARPRSASPAEEPEFIVDLPHNDAASGLHAARWRDVEAHLRRLSETGLPCVGEIRAPPSEGHAVPYADVAGVVVLLKQLGCRRIEFEGAPPPDAPK